MTELSALIDSAAMEFLGHIAGSADMGRDLRHQAQSAIAELNVLQREQRLRLAVVGEFSAGKSTFINALLQEPLLASDLEPTTAVATKITWGPAFQVLVHGEKSTELWGYDRKGPGLLRSASAESRSELLQADGQLSAAHRGRVSDFIRSTTTEAGDGSSGVKEVEICLPSSYLEGAIDIFDTPGFNPGLDGDAQRRHSAVTLKTVAQCHAAVFLIDGRNPLKATERKYLGEFRPYLGKTIFVVNKMDMLVDDEDDEEALDTEEYVRTELPERFGMDGDTPWIAFVSSVSDVDEGGERYVHNLQQLRSHLVWKLETDRAMLLSEQLVRRLTTLVADVNDRIQVIRSDGRRQLETLSRKLAVDPTAEVVALYQVAQGAYERALGSVLSDIEKTLKRERKRTVSYVMSELEPLENPSAIREWVESNLESTVTSRFTGQTQQEIQSLLTSVMRSSIREMTQSFESRFVDIKASPPAGTEHRRIQAIAHDISNASFGGSAVSSIARGEEQFKQGATAATAVGGAVLGAVLLGPFGLALGGHIGKALGGLFGPSLETIRGKLKSSLKKQLKATAAGVLSNASDALPWGDGTGPFAQLVDRTAKAHVRSYRHALEMQQRNIREQVTALEKRLVALGLATEEAQRIIKKTSAETTRLRHELAQHTPPSNPIRRFVVDECVVDKVEKYGFGAVLFGASEMCRTLARVRVHGDSTQSKRVDDVLRSLEMIPSLEMLLEGAGADELWCAETGLSPRLFELSDSDAEIFFPRGYREGAQISLLGVRHAGLQPSQLTDENLLTLVDSNSLAEVEARSKLWAPLLSPESSKALFARLEGARHLRNEVEKEIELRRAQVRHRRLALAATVVGVFIFILAVAGCIGVGLMVAQEVQAALAE